MSLVSGEGEGEQNEIRILQEKLGSTMKLVSHLTAQLNELKEQVCAQPQGPKPLHLWSSVAARQGLQGFSVAGSALPLHVAAATQYSSIPFLSPRCTHQGFGRLRTPWGLGVAVTRAEGQPSPVLWRRELGHLTDLFNSDDRAAETEAAPGLCGCAELHEPLSGAAERSHGSPRRRSTANVTALPPGQVAIGRSISLWRPGAHSSSSAGNPPASQALASRGTSEHSPA